MTRETNFGTYDDPRDAGVPRGRRWLLAALRVASLIAIVVLLGLFVFPVNAHAGRSCETARPSSALIVQGTQPARADLSASPLAPVALTL